MGTQGESLVSPYVDNGALQGDDGGVQNLEYEGHVLQQQWVTLTANMWPEPTESPRGWRVPTEKLPLLAAVFCGAALVVCLLFAFVIYRCCVMPRKEKNFCLKKAEGVTTTTQVPPTATPSYQISQAAVYAEQKGCNWGYNCRILNPGTTQGGHWLYNSVVLGPPQCTQCPGICPVPRSSSHPGGSSHEPPQTHSRVRKQRPVSQPIHVGPSGVYAGGEDYQRRVQMPEISEFSPQGATQYASSSILDEVATKENGETGEGALKTRSLPAWVRTKPRPLSTEDDLNNLYAKVNFSKKRKNRMRNDEAAIIALSKSRSQFLHKDTDSLVDNEAVIVYDERTAL